MPWACLYRCKRGHWWFCWWAFDMASDGFQDCCERCPIANADGTVDPAVYKPFGILKVKKNEFAVD